MRALMSYREAKYKQQKKIKSKQWVCLIFAILRSKIDFFFLLILCSKFDFILNFELKIQVSAEFWAQNYIFFD